MASRDHSEPVMVGQSPTEIVSTKFDYLTSTHSNKLSVFVKDMKNDPLVWNDLDWT